VARDYDRLIRLEDALVIPETVVEGTLALPMLGLTVTCRPAETLENGEDTFTVIPQGPVRVRSRLSGDTIRLPGGTKSLKKLFIDRKIPAHLRDRIPVVVDEAGILGVYGIGPNLDRTAGMLPAVTIRIQKT